MHDHDPRRAYLLLCLSFSLVACGSDDDDKDSKAAGKGGSAAASGGSGVGGTGLTSGSGGAAAAGRSGSSGAGGAPAGASGRGAGGRAQAGTGGSARGGTAGRGAGGASGDASGAAGDAASEGGSGDTGPAPASNWVNATGNLANMESECGNLTLISAMPASGTIVAGVAKVGLFASDDAGAHWAQLGMGAGSAVITNRPSSIVYDPNDENTFWESGIYNGGGLYKTTDGGETFEQLGDISHNDLVSIDFTDPERKTILVGGHEQKQTLYLSTNGGESFQQIGSKLPSGSHFSSAPLVLDAQTFLLGSCGYGDGTCGVYRSENGGEDWDLVSDQPAVARPLWAADDSIYWSLVNNGGVVRGMNDGKDWSKTSDNLVAAYPVELPDGRILTLRGNQVVVSADKGQSWQQVGDDVPFAGAGVAYSVRKKTLFVWHWDCGGIVLPDAIVSAGFDYTKD